MGKRTVVYDTHVAMGAKMVDFAGFDMPLHYGSQIEEHHQVRRHAGIFDVSHMVVVDVLGAGARDYLRYILANDIDKMAHRGSALYSCMLNEQGTVIDDLIVYFIDSQHYRIVLNAGSAQKDLQWMEQHVKHYALGLHRRDDLSILAVQGPETIALLTALNDPFITDTIHTIARFQCADSDDLFIARTGYTGEDGFELIVPNKRVVALWEQLCAAGFKPCGLGARDTLRLEAGYNLYGQDMDESTSPLCSNLAWTIALQPAERLFIGKSALLAEKEHGVTQQLVGLVLADKGILRSHQRVLLADGLEGETTSGSFAPTLGQSIAFARIPKGDYKECEVIIRDKAHKAHIVKPPFVPFNSSKNP